MIVASALVLQPRDEGLGRHARVLVLHVLDAIFAVDVVHLAKQHLQQKGILKPRMEAPPPTSETWPTVAAMRRSTLARGIATRVARAAAHRASLRSLGVGGPRCGDGVAGDVEIMGEALAAVRWNHGEFSREEGERNSR